MSGTIFGQRPVSFGIKGGLLLSDTTIGTIRAEDRWYTFGPSIECRLPHNFAIEFNPLYKRTGYSSSVHFIGYDFHQRARYTSWEFPVLGKYYRGPIFVSGGYTARRQSQTEYVSFDNAPSLPGYTVKAPPIGYHTEKPVHHGFALGVGARFRLLGPLKFGAEYRYSRWTSGDLDYPGDYFSPNRNQHEILIGFTF
jgi:hypothetical protein